MEDFSPLTFGWYRRSDSDRRLFFPVRVFFYYIEELGIRAGEAELRLPLPPPTNGSIFADVGAMAFGIGKVLDERF